MTLEIIIITPTMANKGKKKEQVKKAKVCRQSRCTFMAGLLAVNENEDTGKSRPDTNWVSES